MTIFQADDEVKGLKHGKCIPGDNKLSCMPDKETEEWKHKNGPSCVMNGVTGILDNFIVPDGQGGGESCTERPENINVACEQGCETECLDKRLKADTAEEGCDEERSGGQAAEALRCRTPAEVLGEDDSAKSSRTKLMRNRKTSAGLAAWAPQCSAQAKEQEKGSTTAADEVTPRAPKQRRCMRDGPSVALVKENGLEEAVANVKRLRTEQYKLREARKMLPQVAGCQLWLDTKRFYRWKLYYPRRQWPTIVTKDFGPFTERSETQALVDCLKQGWAWHKECTGEDWPLGFPDVRA